jgi:hypothetical protein
MKKSICFSGAILAGLISISTATINWEIELSSLRDSSGTQVPDDTLWAITYQDSSGNLPGGLENNSSLTIADSAAAFAAFGGRTIATGQTVAGSSILFTGLTDSGVAAFSFTGNIPAGVTSGGIWGLYWFPNLSGNILPTSNFQIGGFTQRDRVGATAVDIGTIGTVIPIDGTPSDVTVFQDNATSLQPTDLPISRFTAIVAVPEPGSLTLFALGVFAFLRRRRN